MKKTVLLITMMALMCVTMMAQSTFNVSGNVVEKESGEAVVAATIQLLSMPSCYTSQPIPSICLSHQPLTGHRS